MGLTIGVDGRDLLPNALTGMGRCVFNLLEDVCLEAKGHRYVVFCNQMNAVQLSRTSSSVTILTMAEGNRIWWDQVALPRALQRTGVDVFFSPYPKVPIWAPAPSVNMVHDVIPLTWPDYRNPFSVHLKRQLYQFWMSRASRTVTVSLHAKDSIARELGLNPDQIVVIPNRISERFFHRPSPSEVQAVREALHLQGAFCLYVGSTAPHKNVGSLLEAYSRLPHELRSAYLLVLAGAGGGGADQLLAGLEQSARSTIRCPGGVSDDALRVLYHEATFFVFPSLAEGFGYPPLEAMACGTPVIAVRTGPMPEVLGEAPYWVESGEPAELGEAIAALLGSESLQQELIERGRRQAERFASTDSTNRLLECLQAVWEENQRASP
jgi:glycosyltransferase involved in cell wall biosynthesis